MVLTYTAGARPVAKLKIGDYYTDGNQWWFHFGEKGGKVHQVPARDDLQKQMKAYIEAAGLAGHSDKTPLFRSAMKRKRLPDRPIPATISCASSSGGSRPPACRKAPSPAIPSGPRPPPIC